MLVLTRTEGESILIGDGVRITVISTKGNQVRFGIDAPPQVTVLREELAGRERKVGPGQGSDDKPR